MERKTTRAKERKTYLDNVLSLQEHDAKENGKRPPSKTQQQNSKAEEEEEVVEEKKEEIQIKRRTLD